ncbi:MAG TPA: hypothetical protein VFR65_01575 [Nitrososphaeraceae archaeon]|jgi:hypothetical protein|nr:hypothetical protein [Nitrososphaeraceae archaeon]HSL14185.1 hypothetical protein [Nitrososphaeraceae archaeon]
MDPNFHNSTISLIIGILVLSIFSLTDTYPQISEMSVIVKLINGDKFLAQTWDINAQLRDKSTDSEISKDQTTFKVNVNQTIQLIIPLSNSTQDLNRYSIFVDASSTIEDIDVFGTIDSVKKENNQITLNLANAR